MLFLRGWGADNCGTSRTATQTITVADDNAPVIVAPKNLNLQCAVLNTSYTGTAVATDICDQSPTVSHTDVVADQTCPNRLTVTRVWRAAGTFDTPFRE